MEKLILIKTLAELKALRDYCTDKDLIAYDVETTGVEKDSKIIGLSVCADTNVGYYVILSSWDPQSSQLKMLETMDGIKEFLTSLVGKSLIMHNAPFDCSMTFNNFGIELMNSVHTDTLMLGHLLNENRSNGLKERGVELYGEDVRAEQEVMKASVIRNGGSLTRQSYELYKADAELIGMYGAKDAILTLKLFYNDVPILFEEGLDKFFYDEETMPLLRGPTYHMNTEGLRVDPAKLQSLKQQLQISCMEDKAFIEKEIRTLTIDKYPGTSVKTRFNVGSSKQMAWLLYHKLGNIFPGLTGEGKAICKHLKMNVPYSNKDKLQFIHQCKENKGQVYCEEMINIKTGKKSKPKKIGDYWNYLSCTKENVGTFSTRYVWAAKLLQYARNLKILNTYVEGIESKAKYNIIRPSFLQHGTTSGRYSSKHPNFQNLPRDDRRIKSCVVSRPGKVFVGADFSQLEPRVFASVSQDDTLLRCFASGEDFYSVIGADVFGKHDCTMIKDDSPNSFPVKYKKLREVAKVIALATPYGATPYQIASKIGKSQDEAAEIINDYFENYPGVHKMMLDSHEQAKAKGVVYNLYGRPRRMPKALDIYKIYGNASTSALPYEARNMLNLAMNHRVQSTAASITNRAAIHCHKTIQNRASEDPRWSEVKIVMQVHDEIILEGPEALATEMAAALKYSMENATILPGVALIAEPKIAHNLADLK